MDDRSHREMNFACRLVSLRLMAWICMTAAILLVSCKPAARDDSSDADASQLPEPSTSASAEKPEAPVHTLTLNLKHAESEGPLVFVSVESQAAPALIAHEEIAAFLGKLVSSQDRVAVIVRSDEDIDSDEIEWVTSALAMAGITDVGYLSAP